MNDVKDIDLDIINACNKIEDGEAIIYIRTKGDREYCNIKGSNESVAMALYSILIKMGKEDGYIIDCVESAIEEYRAKHGYNVIIN